MDGFTVTILVLVGVLAAAIVALVYRGPRAQKVRWQDPPRSADVDAARDSEDLAQMLEAANARRRARGEPELTVEGLLDEVGE